MVLIPVRDAEPLALAFAEIGSGSIGQVGGKGANLGEMTKAGFPVPPGFCVTTAAYRAIVETADGFDDALEELAGLTVESGDFAAQVSRLGAEIRQLLEATVIPDAIADAIRASMGAFGPQASFAVRSSATAEDLPHASFAGQQDTYLNVRGEQALLDAVRRCWASLFTDRAITYRARNGFDHRCVLLSVVVQEMVLPQCAGIAFTADPISGHRGIVAIDAGFGLGEALVSGITSADLYRVDKKTQEVVTRKIADKKKAIRPLADGGTVVEELDPQTSQSPVLDQQGILSVARLAMRIEKHYGSPQDIEWCIDQGELYLLQTRPITSLFPLPAPIPDEERLQIYISVNHAQVMTDAMKPLGFSVLRAFLPFGRPKGPAACSSYTAVAGGRIYGAVTDLLGFAPSRLVFMGWAGMVDPLIAGGLRGVQAAHRPRSRFGFPFRFARFAFGFVLPKMVKGLWMVWFADPEKARRRASALVESITESYRERLEAADGLAQRLRTAAWMIQGAFKDFARFMPFIVAGQLGLALVRSLLGRAVEDPQIAALSRGVAGSVGTEMELAVGDLADQVRDLPEVARALAEGNATLEELVELPGGDRLAEVLARFLERFGVRAPGEIDLTRPRYRDDPSPILCAASSALCQEQAGFHRQHHDELERQADLAMSELRQAARKRGRIRGRLVGRMMRVARGLLGVREHPKFVLVHALDALRRVAIETGEKLVRDDRLDHAQDVFYLELPELLGVLESTNDLRSLVATRHTDFVHHQKLTPPRVISSMGERFEATHDLEGIPDGALPGTSASAGVAEGRVRVVTDPTQARLEPGEVLVAPYTDPGWTPLFLNAAGLIMEVGGMMTHGSVVAREYGIPAVVCVPEATTRLQTGQRVRVDGDNGWVVPLDESGDGS